MDRIGKPRGLIDYMALKDEDAERAGAAPKSAWRHVFRPRTMIYTALWSLVGFGLLFALFIRSDIDISVSPVRNPTFVTLSDGAIRNTYDVRLRNKHGEPREMEFSLSSDAQLDLTIEGLDGHSLIVPPDAQLHQRVYVTAPKGSAAAGAASTALRLWIEDSMNGERADAATIFNGNSQ